MRTLFILGCTISAFVHFAIFHYVYLEIPIKKETLKPQFVFLGSGLQKYDIGFYEQNDPQTRISAMDDITIENESRYRSKHIQIDKPLFQTNAGNAKESSFLTTFDLSDIHASLTSGQTEEQLKSELGLSDNETIFQPLRLQSHDNTSP